MGSFRERPMRFALARTEAFKRAQEPDCLLASPATTRGILFLSRRRARGPVGPRPYLTNHRFISPYSGATFPSPRVIDPIPNPPTADHPHCGGARPDIPAASSRSDRVNSYPGYGTLLDQHRLA